MNYQENALTSSMGSFAPISEADMWIIGIVVAVVLISLLIRLIVFIYDFSSELYYLNIEIERTEGEERSWYIRQRRRLWLSLIPFVRY